jgi:hypothetical protein
LLVLLYLTTLHQIFHFDIVTDVCNNVTVFKSVKSSFSNTKLYQFLEMTSFALNNGLFLIILIVVNLKIVTKLRQSMNLKLKMVGNSAKKIRRSKAKLTITIISDCCNTILGHFCILLYYILKNSLTFGFPYDGIVWSAVYFSYFLKFFIFYYFNMRFRTNANRKVAKIKILIRSILIRSI